MDATDNNVITMGSQTQEEFQEITDEKERARTHVINECSVVESTSDDEISEHKESSQETASISRHGNQEFSTSYEFHR